MKKLSSLFLLALFAIIPAQAEDSIGTVNNLKVINGYPLAKEAQRKISSYRSELDKEFARIGKDLQEQMKDPNLKDKDKLQKQKDAQAQFQSKKVRFDSLSQSLTKDVDDNIQAAIKDVAKEKGLSLVVSDSITYYGGVDITQAVLDKLNGK